MTAKNKHTTASKVASVVSIPGYEIKDLLGRGGMAMVYLAVQESIGREVALKVLSPDHTDDTFSERFLREAKIASQLAHPNIITIFDAGIHNDVHYMSMEYIKGKSFNEARDLLSRKQKVSIIKQIAQALDFASKKGFVHRDIKPENILLHQDGRAILTDFGIAKASDVSKGLTETGKILGTPYFMSPEQTKGLQIDHRTDIYSLGVVLFQALTGYVPYDGPSLVSICIKHLSEPIPQLPKGLEIFQPIINICMSKKPEHRYQYASQLYDALNEISASQLKQIDALAKDLKQQGKVHNAKTMVEKSPALANKENLAKAHNTARKPIKRDVPSHKYKRESRPTFITHSEDFKRLKRRKRNILVVLILIVIAASYYQKNKLKNIWLQQGLPIAEKYLPLETLPLKTKEYLGMDKKKPQPVAPTLEEKTQAAAEIENKKIQILLLSLDKIPSNAKTLARIYSKRAQASPENEKILASIKTLQEWFFNRIATLIKTKNFISAAQALNTVISLYPELKQSKKLSLLNSRLKLDETNEPHLQKSRVYFAVNALNKPEGANAFEQLRIVLNNDPSNAEALLGLDKIASYFKSKAATESRNAKYYNALESVNSGLQAKPNDSELTVLQNDLKGIINNENNLQKLLQQAQKLSADGVSISTTGQSAYLIYKEILKKHPRNVNAKKSLQKIHDREIKKVKAEIQQNSFHNASATLNSLKNLFPESIQLKLLETKLKKEMDAVLPIVHRIKIDNIPFSTITPTNLQKIKIGQLLYIGFEYNNFTQERTKLTTNIYNGNKQKLILQKTLEISGKKGEHFFTIQLPKNGITNGNYSIEILFGNSRLIKANLFGMH